MKDDLIYLEHIVESISNIEHFVKGLTPQQFLKNVEKQYAVIRGLEIIGEAVKNISAGLKQKHPTIAWRDIAGTRDVLIHSYFSADLELVWKIVNADLPLLKAAVDTAIKEGNHL